VVLHLHAPWYSLGSRHTRITLKLLRCRPFVTGYRICYCMMVDTFEPYSYNHQLLRSGCILLIRTAHIILSMFIYRRFLILMAQISIINDNETLSSTKISCLAVDRKVVGSRHMHTCLPDLLHAQVCLVNHWTIRSESRRIQTSVVHPKHPAATVFAKRMVGNPKGLNTTSMI
jgi:hypothetical protein